MDNEATVNQLYKQLWGERQNAVELEFEVNGLDEEVERIKPEVTRRINEDFTPEQLKELAIEFVVQALVTAAKAEIALDHISKIIHMYDDKNVGNKRGKLRRLFRELRSIIQVI